MSKEHGPGHHWNWQDKYLDMLSNGTRHVAACNAVGVNKKTVYEYKVAHPEFMEKCKQAEAEGEGMTLNLVEEMLLEKILIDRHWPAIVFYLVNMGKGKWRDVRQIAITSQDEMSNQDNVAKDILNRLKAKAVVSELDRKMGKAVEGE